MNSTADDLRPVRTVRELMKAGVTHVAGIPDSTSGPLFMEIRGHPTIRLVTVSREGEAFALAAGLWLGGASPLVIVQNTGLLESGDGLRGTVMRMGAPIPILVTGRGYAKMERAGVTPESERTVELLTRADVDSAALFTEPTLDAWGVPHRRCTNDDDPAEAIATLIAETETCGRSRALILTRTLD